MNFDFLGEYNMNRCMDLLAMQMQKNMTAGARINNNKGNQNNNNNSFQNMLTVKEIKSMMASSREEIKGKAAASRAAAQKNNSAYENYAFLNRYFGNNGFF